MVVVTHRVPQEWADREGSPFTFVTDGVPKAIEVAREIAGGKDVVVGAPSVTQQCLQLGSRCHPHRPGAGSARTRSPALR